MHKNIIQQQLAWYFIASRCRRWFTAAQLPAFWANSTRSV